MKITFSQFILLFNNIVKWFYSELNGIEKKQRTYCPNFTDHEFQIITLGINENVNKSNIKEKFVIPVKQNTTVTIFVVDGVKSMNDLHCPSNIQTSIFEDGHRNLTIVVTTAIKNSDNSATLSFLYTSIIRSLLEFVCPDIISSYMSLGDELLRVIDELPKILASTVIDYEELSDDENKMVEDILEFAKPNCGYISLLQDDNLMMYFDSIMIL